MQNKNEKAYLESDLLLRMGFFVCISKKWLNILAFYGIFEKKVAKKSKLFYPIFLIICKKYDTILLYI